MTPAEQAERERLVEAVEESDTALNEALRQNQWLFLRELRNRNERARAALASFDAAHKEEG